MKWKCLKVYIVSYTAGIKKMFHDLNMKPNCYNDLPNSVEEFLKFYLNNILGWTQIHSTHSNLICPMLNFEHTTW
jgi:hypothetical protein